MDQTNDFVVLASAREKGGECAERYETEESGLAVTGITHVADEEEETSFDLHRHLVEGGTVTLTWDPGTPDYVIDARFDAVVEGDPPGYIATAYDASGQEVAYGASRCDAGIADATPQRAVERLHFPYRAPKEPLDPNGPPF